MSRSYDASYDKDRKEQTWRFSGSQKAVERIRVVI